MAPEPVFIRDRTVGVPEDAAAALRAALAGAPALAAVTAAVACGDGAPFAGWWSCEDLTRGGAFVWVPAPAAAAIEPDVLAPACVLTRSREPDALQPGHVAAWLKNAAQAGTARAVPAAVVRAETPFDPPAASPTGTPTMLRTSDGILRPHPDSHSVSVVTVTYNGGAVVRPCVESVLATIGPRDRMVVVDNASDDVTTREILASFDGDPRLMVLYQDDNLGFSKGCNVGIDAVASDTVVLLNPDTEVYPGWLDPMLAAATERRVGAVGPLSDYVAGIQQWHLHARVDPELSLEEIASQIRSAHGGATLDTKLLIGLCMAIPRRVLDDVGVLDEDLFLGNDDLEYSWRLRQHEYRLVVAAGSFVHHDGHVSFDLLPEQEQSRFERESTDALARKLVAHYGWGSVPSSTELWGMDWFRPSLDIWGPEPTSFVIAPPGSRLDTVAAPLRSFLRAFVQAGPCRLVIGIDPEALPYPDDCIDAVLAVFTQEGLDPDAGPEISVEHVDESFDPAPLGKVVWFEGEGLLAPSGAVTVAADATADELRILVGLDEPVTLP